MQDSWILPYSQGRPVSAEAALPSTARLLVEWDGSDLPETRANDPRDCGSSGEVTPRNDKDLRRRSGPDNLSRRDQNPAPSADRLHFQPSSAPLLVPDSMTSGLATSLAPAGGPRGLPAAPRAASRSSCTARPIRSRPSAVGAGFHSMLHSLLRTLLAWCSRTWTASAAALLLHLRRWSRGPAALGHPTVQGEPHQLFVVCG